MTIEYSRHSPSALNLFAECPSMFVMERIKGIKQPVGAIAHRGTAVEAGVAYGLLNQNTADIEALEKAAIKVAKAKYDVLVALSGDARRDKFRADIPEMVSLALEELRHYGVPSATQGFMTWHPEGLRLPIVGYFDFRWDDKGIVTDLKTTDRMPGDIKFGHARQVAFYAASDNMEGRVTYVTPKKCQTLLLENVREHKQALYNIAVIVEDLLSLSDDPDFYLKKFAPALDSFYWSSPAARQLAFEQWGI